MFLQYYVTESATGNRVNIEIDAATQADLDIVFSPMSDETMSWLDELFSTCKRFGVDYTNRSASHVCLIPFSSSTSFILFMVACVKTKYFERKDMKYYAI